MRTSRLGLRLGEAIGALAMAALVVLGLLVAKGWGPRVQGASPVPTPALLFGLVAGIGAAGLLLGLRQLARQRAARRGRAGREGDPSEVVDVWASRLQHIDRLERFLPKSADRAELPPSRLSQAPGKAAEDPVEGDLVELEALLSRRARSKSTAGVPRVEHDGSWHTLH